MKKVIERMNASVIEEQRKQPPRPEEHLGSSGETKEEERLERV